MSKLIFCYWDFRGLGAPARNMLEYGGIEYEHKLVIDGGKWLQEKFELGFDFPNLPYIIDGDVRLTESWAIYKYVAKKVGLFPSGEETARQCDMLEGVIQDIRQSFVKYCLNPDLHSLTEKLLESQKKKIDLVDKYLKSRKFLLGDNLSYLDFALFETLDHHRLLFADIFASYPNVGSYMERFESVDRIAAFLKSNRYHQFPINAERATWGGQKHNDKKT